MTPSSAFLSYSEPDWRLASRLRIDLKRASIDAWTYQSDGYPGEDFVAEYKSRIEHSDVFCLLDSQNARQSEHMRVEAQHALSHGKPIYVCLAEPRLKGGNWWNVELFDDQNLLRAFDLTGDDHQYRAGVQELFFTFGLTYRLPDILLPRTEEFEEEIADLDLRTRRRLLEMWSNFAEVYGSDSRSGIAQLTVLAGYCKRLSGLIRHALSPAISLGVLLGEQSLHSEALEQFAHVTTERPSDARGWAGLAAARFYLRDYDGALAAYRACESATRDIQSRTIPRDIANLTHNIGRVLEAQGRPDEAWRELEKIAEPESTSPHILALKGRLLMKMGRSRLAAAYLDKAYKSARQIPVATDLSLICDLIDCYARLGFSMDEERLVTDGLLLYSNDRRMLMKAAEFYWRNSDVQSCLANIRQAIETQADSLACRGMPAQVLWTIGKKEEAVAEANKCIERGPISALDRYYLGLALHIAGAPGVAKYQLAKARKASEGTDWPSYEMLLRN